MHTHGELRALLVVLQKNQVRQALDSDAMASAFDLDNKQWAKCIFFEFRGITYRISPSDHSLGYSERQLYNISRELKLLQSRIQFLSAEEEKAHLACRRARNRLLPVGSLPDEVLSTILLLSILPLDASIWHAPAFAVSHHWRQCAIDDARFWQDIYVGDNTGEDEVELWLARSQTTLINVKIKLEYCSHNHFLAMHDLITPQLDRIRSLHYDTIIDSGDFFPLQLPSSSLNVLSIYWNTEPSSSPYDIFDDFPPSCLSELELETAGFARDQLNLIRLDVSRLKKLKIGEAATVQSVWAVLSKCQMLQELTWFCNEEGRDVEPLDLSPLSSPVMLQTLRRLSVDGSLVAPVLELIHAPNLERLQIYCPTVALSNLISCITRHHQLQRLSLNGIDGITVDDLRALFTKLSMLEYFICEPWSVSNIAAIETLSAPATASVMGHDAWSCPHLSTLSIGLPFIVDEAELIRALDRYLRPLLRKRSRKGTACPLTVILPKSETVDGLSGIDGIHLVEPFGRYTWPDE